MTWILRNLDFVLTVDQKEILELLKRISELLDSWSFLVLVRTVAGVGANDNGFGCHSDRLVVVVK